MLTLEPKKIILVSGLSLAAGVFLFFAFLNFKTFFAWQRPAGDNQSIVVGNSDIVAADTVPVLIPRLRILVFGDAMLDRGVLLAVKKANDFNFPFLNIDSFLADADLRVMNLEGPITNFPSRALKNNRMIFTFPENYLDALKKRFDVVSLANNHTLNFGYDGLKQTRDFLTRVGINFFGAPDNNQEDLSAVIEKNGIKIGWLGYNLLAKKDMAEISTAVGELKQKSDFVIVYPHWGNEYQSIAAPSQRKEAQALIDAGADLIIGSHPHVIQNVEIYPRTQKSTVVSSQMDGLVSGEVGDGQNRDQLGAGVYKGKVIFYSLGNFIFDQYFSKETMQGLAVGIDLEKSDNGVVSSYKLFPIKINGQSQPELADFETAQKILMQISNNSWVDETVKNSIKDGAIENKTIDRIDSRVYNK